MTKVKVKSSAINTVEYDEDRKSLTVTFKNDKSYVYLKVPHDVFNDLLLSDSVGKFYNASIKPIYEEMSA